jgi:Tol biopolymer transport system component
MRGFGLLAALAVAGGCGGEPPASDLPTGDRLAGDPPGRWSIETAAVVVGARRNGRVDLIVVHADGSEVPVVATEASEVGPRFSPDGVRIAFHARTDGSPYELFIADPGSVVPLVVDDDTHAIGAVWSPDGRQVAYFSDRGEAPAPGGLPGNVWIHELDSGAERRLAGDPLDGTTGPSDWSPDGRWILLSRRFDGQLDVVRVDVSTGREERLTTGPEDEYGATFSGDGDRIAYHVDDGTSARIAILGVDSNERRLVTPEDMRRYGPVWSPDDAWLLVNAEGAGGDQYDLVAIRVADGLERAIVATPEDERYGAWVPLGSPWATHPEVAR